MDKIKPLIFVSHAEVDSKITNLFKTDVEESFLGLCELFVSSDLDSLQGGEEWMKVIQSKLKDALIFIGMLSPIALTRPWIYTEFGGAWIRGIPTITLCHSGLRRDQLSPPLSHFQALDLLNLVHIEHLYNQISSALRCKNSNRDFIKDIDKYKIITDVQKKERSVRQWFAQIQQWNPGFSGIFQAKEVEVLIPSAEDYEFRKFMQEMAFSEMIKFEPKGMALGTPVGMQASVWIAKQGAKFNEIKWIVE